MTDIRKIVKEFLQGEEIKSLNEAKSPNLSAQDAMNKYIDSMYGASARVGSKEWKEADAARREKDAQAAAEQQEPLPKDKLDAEIGRLRQLMQRHDWYYQYSEDQRIWAAGNKQDGMIRSLANQLRKRGHSAEVDELYKKHDPRKRKQS